MNLKKSKKKAKMKAVKTPLDFQRHRVIGINTKGRDYFVGDIHGRYERLMTTLRQMRFDKTRDRLFAVGDLVDRGYENMDVIGLLEEPWFFSAVGNHEELLVNAINNPNDKTCVINHVENGGDWAWVKDEEAELGVSPTPEGIRAAEAVLAHCSLMMTVETPSGRIGVVHADCPRVWPGAEDPIEYNQRWLWSRKKHKELQSFGEYSEPHQVHNIDAVVHGHCSYHEVLGNANRLWIDTASYGEFSIFPADELLYFVRKQMDRQQKMKPAITNPWM